MSDTIDDVGQLIAARLKAARKRKFPSAAAAARALGMNEVTVRAHETGQNGVPIDVMIKYVRAYGADINWIIRGHRTKDFTFDPDNGIAMPVNGAIATGIYVDPDVPREPLPALHVPAVDRFFGYEVYQMQSGDWSPIAPAGSHLICTPADVVTLRPLDLVVVERDRAGLKELTLWMLEVNSSGEAVLNGPAGSANQLVLTGPSAVEGVEILAFVRQVVRNVPRAPVDQGIHLSLPVRKRPEETL